MTVLKPLSTEDLSPVTKRIVEKCNEIVEASNKGNQTATINYQLELPKFKSKLKTKFKIDYNKATKY